MNTLTIVAIDGAAREKSNTRRLVHALRPYFEKAGASLEVFDQLHNPLPIYDEREETSRNPSVRRLIELVGAADGIVLSSPEYHGSMSGALKNALDWLSYLSDTQSVSGKVVGLVGGGASFANSGAVVQMMMAVRALHAWLMPDIIVSVPNIWDAFTEDGELRDEKLQERAKNFAANLTRYAEIFRTSFPAAA